MAENWLADVRKYDADADEGVVGAIVKYCGVALTKRDSSLVAMSDPEERMLVRENYLKKKLALTDSDETLDAAVLSVGEAMKADRTKNRVTVYYLLAKHFGVLNIFGGTAGSAPAAGLAGAAAMAGGALGLAAMPAAAADEPEAEPVAAASSATAPVAAASVHPVGANAEKGGFLGFGCTVAALVIGAIILAALLAWWAMRDREPPVAPAPAPVAAAPVAAPAPTIPEGAGVVATEEASKPKLTVYFDTGKSDVTPDFAAAAAEIKAYVDANPGAKLAVSGFNDPTGNAAANAELSKNRAQAVGKALEQLGIPATAIELVKPEETTDASGDNTNARRVEVTVQ